MRTPLLLLLAPLLLAAGPTTAPSARPAHDRDPWIFRCVLDGNARMVVISLGHDVWAAYDANRCRFAKLWTGKVEFTGPVFDTRHGPQPKSDGVMLLDRPARLAPLAEPVLVEMTTQPTDEELNGYRGYRIHGDVATLNFEFEDTKVEETPSFIHAGDPAKLVTFRREIKVSWDTSKLGTRTIELPTSPAVRTIRVMKSKPAAAGEQEPASTQPAYNDGPELAFDADKNGYIELREPATIVIDTTLSTE